MCFLLLVALFLPGATSAGIALNSARYLGTKKEFGKRADNNFSDTAQQLNEVIQ